MNTSHTTESHAPEYIDIFTDYATPVFANRLCEKAFDFVLTPDKTFERKLNLIEKANDMTTPQKLEAMKQAEAKHIADKLIYLMTTLAVVAASTHEGKSLIEAALKKIA